MFFIEIIKKYIKISIMTVADVLFYISNKDTKKC